MSTLHDKRKDRNKFLAVKTRTLDLARTSRYFAALEALAREARETRDPRVQLVALDVLEMQRANVRELLGA